MECAKSKHPHFQASQSVCGSSEIAEIRWLKKKAMPYRAHMPLHF
jgi:hypothetical protein